MTRSISTATAARAGQMGDRYPPPCAAGIRGRPRRRLRRRQEELEAQLLAGPARDLARGRRQGAVPDPPLCHDRRRPGRAAQAAHRPRARRPRSPDRPGSAVRRRPRDPAAPTRAGRPEAASVVVTRPLRTAARRPGSGGAATRSAQLPRRRGRRGREDGDRLRDGRLNTAGVSAIISPSALIGRGPRGADLELGAAQRRHLGPGAVLAGAEAQQHQRQLPDGAGLEAVEVEVAVVDRRVLGDDAAAAVEAAVADRDLHGAGAGRRRRSRRSRR